MGDENIADGLVLTALEHGATTGRGLSTTLSRGLAVHRALRRLERDGLVQSSELPRARGRQRLYRLTRAGEEALAAWRLTLVSLARTQRARSGGPLASAAWPSPPRSSISPT